MKKKKKKKNERTHADGDDVTDSHRGDVASDLILGAQQQQAEVTQHHQRLHRLAHLLLLVQGQPAREISASTNHPNQFREIRHQFVKVDLRCIEIRTVGRERETHSSGG